MKCPWCQIAFHVKEDDWESTTISDDRGSISEWTCSMTFCPDCRRLIVMLIDASGLDEEVIYPYAAMPINIGLEIPESLRADYLEAVRVLQISAKASAALSRRVLQGLLNEQGYGGGNLAKQIDSVLTESDPDKGLPLTVRKKIDAVRNFGNFSAHPITDVTTLQIIDVDPEEAEWCLEIVSELFDHYYVRPAEDTRKLAELNQKLADAGKPPTK